MLLDSNIIIYSIKPEYAVLRELIKQSTPSVSAISYFEVLGYHKLTREDEKDFYEFFDNASIIPITQSVLDQAVNLRQQRKMSAGDAIVASTALLLDFTVVTVNTKDFDWIPGLGVFNPLKIA